MAEPEAAMGGLWLASLMAGAESEQNCETSPAAELMRLEGHTAERITFGVDSGAALTVIGKDVAAEYPRVQGLTRRMTDCQGTPVVDLGQNLALRGPTGRSFARVTVASVPKNLLSVEFLIEDWARSCSQQWQELHPASEGRCAAADGGEEWCLRGELRPLSLRCGDETRAASR